MKIINLSINLFKNDEEQYFKHAYFGLHRDEAQHGAGF